MGSGVSLLVQRYNYFVNKQTNERFFDENIEL